MINYFLFIDLFIIHILFRYVISSLALYLSNFLNISR